jgi:hypothetical protein
MAKTIAKRKSSKSEPVKAKLPRGVKDLGYGLEVTRRTTWLVPKSGPPKTADDLSFTSRGERGINWWDVVPPKTDYWHVHEMLGRAYAFELLDLINRPSKERPNVAAYVCKAVGQWSVSADRSADGGMADGFFAVIGEFLETGTAAR